MKREWLEATAAGDIVRVCTLIDAGADIDALDRHGQTALMNAAHRGDTQLVQVLADRGAHLDHTAKYRLTALMLAVINNHAEVVRVLVASGADRTIQGNRGSFACTPLQYAQEHGQTQIVSLLSDGA